MCIRDRAGSASACTGCAAQLRHACHLELCDASEVHCLLAPTAHVGSLEMAHKPHRWPRGLEGGCQASAYPDTPLAPFGVPLVATAVASLCSPRWGRHTLWTPDCGDAMARPWPHAMDATVGLAWRSRPVGTLVSGRHVVISPLVVDTEVANCGRQQLTFGLLLACLWLASGGLGHPSSDSSSSGPMPWRRRVGELSLWASRCILSCTWPQWRSAHVGRPLPCRTSTVPALPALQSTLRRHAAAL